MFNIDKFHEEGYDGLVLKFPKWFLDMNQEIVEAHLDALAKALENDGLLSAHHPDHKSNIYELANYKRKGEFIAAQRAKIQDRAKEEEMRLARVLAWDEIPVIWSDVSGDGLDRLNVALTTGKSLSFEHDEVVTSKGNARQAFIDKFATFEDDIDLPVFARQNNMSHLLIMTERMKDDQVDEILPFFEFNGFNTGYAAYLRIKYRIAKACMYFKNDKNDKVYYKETFIGFDGETGELSVLTGNTTRPNHSLKDYTFDGHRLIRKVLGN